jgi:HAAS domain-containing protein
MTEPGAARQAMEEYLKVLRRSLRGLPEEDAGEIVEELRSHLLDSGSDAGGLREELVRAALERLGPPRELAAQYVLESLARKAARSRSPFLILESCFRWAEVSVRGFLTLLLAVTGYGLSVPFVLAALLKPFRPDRVGLWKLAEAPSTYSLRMGFGASPAGTELLGWWLVPLGLVAGTGLLILTTWFGLWSLRRFARDQAGFPR